MCLPRCNSQIRAECRSTKLDISRLAGGCLPDFGVHARNRCWRMACDAHQLNWAARAPQTASPSSNVSRRRARGRHAHSDAASRASAAAVPTTSAPRSRSEKPPGHHCTTQHDRVAAERCHQHCLLPHASTIFRDCCSLMHEGHRAAALTRPSPSSLQRPNAALARPDTVSRCGARRPELRTAA